MSQMRDFLTRSTVLIGLCLTLPTAAQAQDVVVSPVAAAQPIDLLNTLVGEWDGQLEYLDYSAKEWFGIPARTTVRAGGDGVTFIRTTDFDDGPQTGIVRITTVSMLGVDGATEYTTGFRKGRVPELTVANLRVESYTDAVHWVLVSDGKAMDAGRSATVRLTTTRDGDKVVTLKQVDYDDDDKSEWLDRNRTTLSAAE